MSNSDPNATGNDQPPAGYPGAQHPEAPAYPPPPAYGTPAGAPGYPQAPPAYAAPGYPAQPGYGGYAPPTKTNALAIVSMVLSIAGLVFIPFLGSLVGAILGHVALGQLKTSREQGRGFALAGVIIGWVGLGLAVIGTIAFFAWIGWLTSMSTTYSA